MHVVINGWFGGQLLAGSGQYLHRLLEHLPAAAPDTRFTLLLPHGGALDSLAAANLWPDIEILAIVLPPLPRQLAKLLWEQWIVPRRAQQLSADVLWVPYWAAPWQQPCPTVVTVHDLIPQLLPAYRGGMLQRIYTRLVARTTARAVGVVTVSKTSAADIIRHLQIPNARVHSIYHGPNVLPQAAVDVARQRAVRSAYGLPERYFLYLGPFDVRKNVNRILEAYACYLERAGDSSIKLVIAGKPPTEDSAFTPDPRRRAVELGLAGQVIFCGFVEESDKSAVYAMATAYLFPSLYEGFGMMVIEAQAAGVPVVTSNRAYKSEF